MRVIGYTRISKGEAGALGLEAQEAAIRARFPQAEVVTEVKSGRSASNRAVLAEARRTLRRNDALVVARLDRLARSVADFGAIIEESQRRGWALVVLDQALDTSTANGRLVANVLASVAQWEREMISERTKAALAAKRADGWEPRKLPATVHADIQRLHAQGRLSQRAIALRLGLTRRTVAASLARPG